MKHNFFGKYFFAVLAVSLFLFGACGTLGSLFSPSAENSASAEQPATGEGSAQKTTPKANEPSADWNLAALDTARKVSYLSAEEKNVILEMNKVRSNPKLYAQLYIEPRIAKFSDKIYVAENGTRLATQEGAAAVRECVAALKAQRALSPLAPSKGISQAAKDHVLDTGSKGIVGHDGSNGSSPWDRMNRYGTWGGVVGENIAYASKTAQEIVVQLLIDDGVAGRGHRENILKADFAIAGCAIGSHKSWGSMCVIDYAGTYKEK